MTSMTLMEGVIFRVCLIGPDYGIDSRIIIHHERDLDQFIHKPFEMHVVYTPVQIRKRKLA